MNPEQAELAWLAYNQALHHYLAVCYYRVPVNKNLDLEALEALEASIQAKAQRMTMRYMRLWYGVKGAI